MTEQYAAPNQSIPELLEALHSPQPTVVAFEGGPCGGKTTVVDRLADASTAARPVAIVPEAATQHIVKLMEKGISISDLVQHDRAGFLALEADILGSIVASIEQTKREYAGTDAIILADRSDIGAYVSAEEYRIILSAIGRQRPPHLDLVDKMVYLPSLAREDADHYDRLMATNAARYETAADAVATCERNLGAVAMHPELSMHWGGDFEDKVARVTEEVLHPETEVEAKFTINPAMLSYELVPTLLRALTEKKLGAFAIRQSYHEWDGQEFRLRQTTTEDGDDVCHYTVKTGQGSVRHELQRIITAQEYRTLQQAPSYGELHKTRQRYLVNLHDSGRLMVLSADMYDDRQHCVLEIEGMTDEEAARLDIPGFRHGGVPARELVQ